MEFEMSALLLAAVLVLITTAAFVFRKRGAAPLSVPLNNGKTGLGSKNASTASLKALAPDPSKPSVRILYGTQTGTAERFAKQLGKELSSKYGDSTAFSVVDVENYGAAELLQKEKLVILCMATYGDGEPTDNAAEFYKWLLKEAEEVDGCEKEPFLSGVNYAVYGLGNKQYEHFNAVGKKVFKALGELGGAPLIRRGDGDDDACIDEDFEKWCEELHSALEKRSDLVGAKAEQKADESVNGVAAYDVHIVPAAAAGAKQAPAFPSSDSSGLDAHHPFMARITRVQELHGKGSDRACVHIEVDFSGSKISYKHGDHIAVHAQNSQDVIEEVASMLGHPSPSGDVLVTLRRPSAAAPNGAASSGLSRPPFSGPLPLRSAIGYFADVLSSPNKTCLWALAAFASNPAESQRLRRMALPEGKDEYSEYIAKPHRSLLEVLRDFPSTQPVPIGAFFGSLAPRLQPRFYSISSSPALHPTAMHITAAVVKDTMPTGRVHEGIASTWLQRSLLGGAPHATVPVFVRHSSFKLPSDPSVPVIMVGPGTGLAPFRGFLQERATLKTSGSKLGPGVLFFGCRHRDHDYIYQEDLEGWLKGGVLSELHVAFSRDGPKKDYVQHHMERHGEQLWKLLSDQRAFLYVCGDAKSMAKDVHRALVGLVQAGKGCNGTQAEAYVKQLQDTGRYQRDVW